MWYYKDKEIKDISDFPEDTYGFIYEITHIPSGVKYIGKKVLFFERNVKLGKKEYEELVKERKEKGIGGRVPQKKKVRKESDWKTYYGSQKEIKDLVKESNKLDFKKEILMLVNNKKLLTYWELYYLFINNSILPGSKYLNSNLLGKFYTKDFLDD